MEMTALERAARALFWMDSGARADKGLTTKWVEADAITREKYVKEVRAVLDEIREPDEAMIEAGFRAPEREMNMGQHAAATWSAMIDAALA